jgi:hypothetical protein
MEAFCDDVAHDVASAVGGKREKLLILSLQPGSVIVELLLQPGICGGESPANVAHLLQVCISCRNE